MESDDGMEQLAENDYVFVGDVLLESKTRFLKTTESHKRCTAFKLQFGLVRG